MISREEILKLATPKDGVAVSILVPMHRIGPDTRENPIRFKNAVQEARRRLEAAGWSQDRADELLAPLFDRVDDNDFWQHQFDGLACYLAEGEEPVWHRVWLELPEMVSVSNRFHVKPLLQLLEEAGPYFVLAASMDEARLYVGSRTGFQRLELPDDVPTSLEEAIRFDEPAAGTREHGGDAPQQGRNVAAPGTGIAHGTGDVEHDKKQDVARWFKWLDNGVRKVMNAHTNGGKAPLLFAGVDYMYDLYRAADHSGALLDAHVSGNPDTWRDEELHVKAWEVLEDEHFDRPRIRALQHWKNLSGTDATSEDPDAIVDAARNGRVDTIIVGIDKYRWGRFDERTGGVIPLPEEALESYDLHDATAVEALRTGATVYAVPGNNVPNGAAVVATFRY